MTLRITDDFTLTRSGQHLVVEVFGAFPARVRLGPDDVRKAKEAFGIMAAMMGAVPVEPNANRALEATT